MNDPDKESTNTRNYCVNVSLKEDAPDNGPIYVKINKEAITPVKGLGHDIEVTTPSGVVDDWGIRVRHPDYITICIGGRSGEGSMGDDA